MEKIFELEFDDLKYLQKYIKKMDWVQANEWVNRCMIRMLKLMDDQEIWDVVTDIADEKFQEASADISDAFGGFPIGDPAQYKIDEAYDIFVKAVHERIKDVRGSA